MMLEKCLRDGIPVEGIGMQYHLHYKGKSDSANPLRLLDVFDCYSDFKLPIHVSEVSIPSYTCTEYELKLQAEITKRLYMLWFGRKYCESIVWWNIADGTAYRGENETHSGIIDNNCNEKPVYAELDKLINNEWRTEFEKLVDGELRFSGFFGEYEITVQSENKRITTTMELTKDNTGFDNNLCDFRSKTVII